MKGLMCCKILSFEKTLKLTNFAQNLKTWEASS